MVSHNSRLSRRSFLASSAAGLLVSGGLAQQPKSESVSFFVIGDTHYLADKNNSEKPDARSAVTTAKLIERLNQLPGTAISENSGGGKVEMPRGVIHAGDLIDTGDKSGELFAKMQKTEWQHYVADFGLDGKDGKLKYPVYEVHGNHDAPQGTGLVIDRIIERNRKRPGVTNVSKNGLHYSWDWGNVHFIALGIVVGAVPAVKRKRKYNPLDSLDFLTADLGEKVGKSGRPVVITHHVDVLRYATPPDPDGPATGKEWDPCDVKAYHDALRGHNVIAVFYGHTHTRNVFRWDGTAKRAEKGIPVFNVTRSSHFNSPAQGMFCCSISEKELVVREYVTPDRWQTTRWTPQVWKVPLGS